VTARYTPRADVDYRVRRRQDIREVSALVCVRCGYAIARSDVSGANAIGWVGGASGLPRYNRMRARMVHHIFAQHRAAIGTP
jgi:hypothetical protein